MDATKLGIFQKCFVRSCSPGGVVPPSQTQASVFFFSLANTMAWVHKVRKQAPTRGTEKHMRQGPSVSPGQNLFWTFEAQVARTKAVAGRGRRDGSPTGPKEASSKTHIYIRISSDIRRGSTGYPAIASRFSEMQSSIARGSPRISSRISLIYNTISDRKGSLPDSYI